MEGHKEVLSQHHALDVLLRDLRMVTQWDPQLLGDEKVRMRFVWDLHALQARLRDHFQTEESGAYLEEITSRKPDAGDLLLELQSEHRVFLVQLASMEKTCQENGQTNDVIIYKSVLTNLLLTLDLLKRHEEKENYLIKEVFQGG